MLVAQNRVVIGRNESFARSKLAPMGRLFACFGFVPAHINCSGVCGFNAFATKLQCEGHFFKGAVIAVRLCFLRRICRERLAYP